MTATTLPKDLAQGRNDIIDATGLAGNDVGALPDESHKKGGGYHCGVQDIINLGKYPTGDYSTRQTRDRVGGNACSAIDVGDNWPKGGRAAWIRWNNMVVAALKAGDPELAALRAINFTPDGTARKRYDTNSRDAGVIDSTDTVTIHTHLEFWRNTSGAARARAIARLVALMRAAIAGQSAPTGGFTMLSACRKGDKGSAPFALQCVLIGYGYLAASGADGDYGPKTAAALKQAITDPRKVGENLDPTFTGEVFDEWGFAALLTRVVSRGGKDGKDGHDGTDGKDGKDAVLPEGALLRIVAG